MANIDIRKDLDEGIVEVDTGGGWRGLSPDAARDFADGHEKAIEQGRLPNTGETRNFVNLLRQYADDIDGGE